MTYVENFFIEDSIDQEINKISEELNIDFELAADVFYLRSRNRYTPELEKQFLELAKTGCRPNMNEFGVTKETQERLMSEVKKILKESDYLF